MFQRILVANRGEIALRVIRACQELGIEAVAVFSEADRGAPYLELADEAICIGPAAGRRELSQHSAHHQRRRDWPTSQAIHPGYGFLSENPHFAEKCRDCKIEFIGPPHEAMHQLGNKNQARKLAEKAGVPVVPGSDGLIDQRGASPHACARPSAIPCSSRRRPAAAAAACAWPATRRR